YAAGRDFYQDVSIGHSGHGNVPVLKLFQPAMSCQDHRFHLHRKVHSALLLGSAQAARHVEISFPGGIVICATGYARTNQIFRAWSFQWLDRSSRLRTFPKALLGSPSTKSTDLGFLYEAIRARQNSISSGPVAVRPSRKTTRALTDSPHWS